MDAAIQSRIGAIGLDAYVNKLAKDVDKADSLPQKTEEEIDKKIKILVGTMEIVKHLLERSDVKNTPNHAVLVSKLASLNAILGQPVSSPADGGKRWKMPRKMSRKYCKKTPCKKMGFTQRSSCRPYKNCFTRRARRKV